jgi:glycerophosphoryl diester phosphodiesterase
MNYWTQSKDNIWVAAHRGWCAKYPENTMEAFRAALELGVDQIETDVRMTKDGELVCMHDACVCRTTNGGGYVRDLTLEQIKELDAGIRKGPEFAGCKVPTFIEFMDLVKDHPTITIDIELKGYPVPGSEYEMEAFDICDRVLKIVDDYGFRDRCVINTFSGRLQEYLDEKYHGMYRQHVYYPKRNLGTLITRDPYEYAYCCCMFGENDYMATKEEFEAMRERGVRTWAGAGVKDEASVLRAIEAGAELITCNNCDEILDLLRKHGKHK